MNAGRAIIGGSIGTGVAAGASMALSIQILQMLQVVLKVGWLVDQLGEYYKTEVLDIKMKKMNKNHYYNKRAKDQEDEREKAD
jgi:hypothetical protein